MRRGHPETLTWKTFLAMSRAMVVVVFIVESFLGE
jgi:hypothetical protein